MASCAYFIKYNDPYVALELRQQGQHYQLYRQVDPNGPFEPVWPVFVKSSTFRDWLEYVFKPKRVGCELLEEVDTLPEDAERLTHQLNEHAFRYRKAQSEVLEQIARIFWQEVNGKHFVGQHPINYYARTEPDTYESTDAIYDIINEKWLKVEDTPEFGEIKEQFPVAYATAEALARKLDLLLGELRRHVRDELSRQEYSEDELSYVAQQEPVQQLLEQLSEIYQTLHTARRNAFEQETDRWSRNWSDENIVWKLLEHWSYGNKLEILADMFWDDNRDLDLIAKVAQHERRQFKLTGNN